MYIYRTKDLHWEDNYLYHGTKFTGLSYSPDSIYSGMYRVVYHQEITDDPIDDRSADMYNLPRAKQHCIDIAMEHYRDPRNTDTAEALGHAS